MKRTAGSLLIPGAVLLALAAGSYWYWLDGSGRSTPGQLEPSKTRVVAQGQGLYQEHCASCHGASLEGQADWKQRKADGRLPAPPHDASGHTWHHPAELLLRITKLGPAALVGGDYESDMPSYEGVLSDQEILAILSFIKSTWPEKVRQRHDQISAKAAAQ